MTKKYLTRLLQASLMCCLAVFFTACDDMFATEDNPTSAYLGMSEKPVTIKVGETFQRQAIAAGTAVIEYTSSDTKVATVDNTGLVTAIAEGETTITATATGYSSQTGKKIYLPDSKSYKLTVESAGPAATITTAPAATATTISAGSATDLVTVGVADGGTMMYQVTATNTKPTTTDGFSATVPTAATLAAGTCYVWYYAKGDATHSNSKIAGPVEVTLIDGYAANEYNEAYWYDGKVVFTKETAASVTAVTNSDTDVTWGAGWYTVSGNVIIKGKVTLSADTHLILQDGATLTINGQLDCRTNSKDLYIYGQMEGTGKLNITCNDNALYGDPGYTLHIHGGEITATATGDSHYGLYFGKIVMYSGKLTATAADYHAIGFNVHGFIVYGGEVEATSNATTGDFSGIQSSGPLKVYVGKVKGTGGAPSGKGFECKVQTGTSNIKFYFSDNGTTWGPAYSYNIAAIAPGNRYAKAE